MGKKRSGRNAQRPTNNRRRERERQRLVKKNAAGEHMTQREQRLFRTKAPQPTQART